MAPPLDSKYKLGEVDSNDPAEIDAIFLLLEKAIGNDEMSISVFRDVKPEDVHPWYMKTVAPRWALPDITIYKITEVATGRLCGWTGLQFPWDIRPVLNDEMKAMVLSHDLPPVPEGSNMDAVEGFFHSFSFAGEYGYDEEKDFHRKATMIHPDFQKQGLGTALTKHCNAISDKAGRRTFVPARPTSYEMFKQNGFKEIGQFDQRLERFGLSREKSVTYMLLRGSA